MPKDRSLDYFEIDFRTGKEITVRPLLDERKLKLPEAVVLCPHCRAHGQYLQFYCDAGRMTGPCGLCEGAQFLYAATAKPVPNSVREQIATTNGLCVGEATYAAHIKYRGRLFHPGEQGTRV